MQNQEKLTLQVPPATNTMEKHSSGTPAHQFRKLLVFCGVFVCLFFNRAAVETVIKQKAMKNPINCLMAQRGWGGKYLPFPSGRTS